MHPLALQLAGKPEPVTGLEGKLSVYHACAVALIRGNAGVDEFTDACVQDPEVLALRARVSSVSDETLDKAAAVVTITLADGRGLEREVPTRSGRSNGRSPTPTSRTRYASSRRARFRIAPRGTSSSSLGRWSG
jgi:2-methylcitrate dehydratase PrpD